MPELFTIMKKAAKINVSGTVQGVFFRKFAKENADSLNLKGYVRNTEGGDVEILVEGDSTNIQRLTEKLKQGPPHAQIRNVNIEEKSWTGEFKEFKILRF